MTNSTNTPNALIITDSYLRLNGPDGRSVTRANLLSDGTWDVRLPGRMTETDDRHRTMTLEAAQEYMVAQSTAYALTH